MKTAKLFIIFSLCLAGLCCIPRRNAVPEGLQIQNYSQDMLVDAAEQLFQTSFQVVSSHEEAGHTLVSYRLRPDTLPFEFSVFSEAVLARNGSSYSLHPWCDYYARKMEYFQEEATKLAGKYGLSVTVQGQKAYVSVQRYDQLAQVYAYLNDTNQLYNFTVEESQLTGLLRDIRTRPTLSVRLDKQAFGREDEITLLYYTINPDTYSYTKDALLPTLQENYITLLDRLALTDQTVTADIREKIVHPAITQLRINGQPAAVKACDGYVLDPNIIFDYNWEQGRYCGDVRICAPAEDYNALPSPAGDDRNFKYLVELLGGTYTSSLDTQYNDILAAYSAHWYAGGKAYGAATICQEYIPIESAFSAAGFPLSIDCTYSKEMWGLENGYGPEDYCLRLTPEGLGDLLGVRVEANYEEGWLDLITPPGYLGAGIPEQYPEQFLVEKAGLDHSHYVIYKADGSILEEADTEGYCYAYCQQLAENIVSLKISDHGCPTYWFFNTETGEKSQGYDDIALIQYPLFVYHPADSTLVTVCEIFGQDRSIDFETDIYFYGGTVIEGAEFSPDMKQVTVTYLTNRDDFSRETKTFDLGDAFTG